MYLKISNHIRILYMGPKEMQTAAEVIGAVLRGIIPHWPSAFVPFSGSLAVSDSY